MIADLVVLGGVVVLAFVIGYAKGSEFTEDRIRTKFRMKGELFIQRFYGCN